ncbi:MAG: response regulator [Endomicrobiales bacterium]
MKPRKLKILIADPEEGIRISMAWILELEGYIVRTARTGFEAIDDVKKESFDIAFLDIRMPGINGVETFKEIKKHSPETVVVMMSAFPVTDLIKEAINEGAYACLSKPFDMDNIISTIKEVASRPFVMVVDDDTNLCDLLYHRFKDSGFNVVTKTSGLDGIKAAQRRIPDVLFLDVVMNGLNGIETLEKINEMFGENKPKTIIMSSYDSAENFKAAKELGAVECLRKPLNTSQIKAMVNKLTQSVDGGKICIVEGNPELCSTLSETLTNNGYIVEKATSADEAIEKLNREPFRVVIIDSNKADGNGVAVYDRIKQVNPEMGVIFVSGNNSTQTISNATNKNNYMYLIKPFEPENLLEIITTIQQKKVKK